LSHKGNPPPFFLLTAEHSASFIPQHWQKYLSSLGPLEEHRLWDPGTEQLFQSLKGKSHYCAQGAVSRILIDLSRSLDHQGLFPIPALKADPHLQESLLNQYYHPFRQGCEKALNQAWGEGRSLFHLSLHSFTPQWKGKSRSVDIGILVDSRRQKERTLAQGWKKHLQEHFPQLNVFLNRPYYGHTDGHVSFLRKHYPQDKYQGIELEVKNSRAPVAPLSCLGQKKAGRKTEFPSSILF